MSDNVLIAKNIYKTFSTTKHNKIEVLKGINLEIPLNKISVIIGSSGAGKSTLLHILSGLDRPDSGEVLFENTNIFSLNDDKLTKFRNKNIGFVFQFHHLLPEFTAAENIAIPQMMAGKNQKKSIERGIELLRHMNLEERADHKPAELSGGEQQRTAIARALANDPALIFADEPTGNLDSVNSETINNIILGLRDTYNKTFVIVSHNPELVKLADVVFEIKDGVISTS